MKIPKFAISEAQNGAIDQQKFALVLNVGISALGLGAMLLVQALTEASPGNVKTITKSK